MPGEISSLILLRQGVKIAQHSLRCFVADIEILFKDIWRSHCADAWMMQIQ